MAFGDYHGLNPQFFKVHGSQEEYMMDIAEQAVFDLCERHGVDFSQVSDTGTVENLMENHGYSYGDIANGEVAKEHFLDSICWL